MRMCTNPYFQIQVFSKCSLSTYAGAGATAALVILANSLTNDEMQLEASLYSQ